MSRPIRFPHTAAMLQLILGTRDLTQYRLSKLSGVPTSSLSNLHAGRKQLTTDIADRLRSVLTDFEVQTLLWARLMDEAEQLGLIGGAAS